MALQLSMSDDFGNSYPEGYRRLVSFGLDVPTETIRAQFADYKDQGARKAGHRPFRVNPPYIVTATTTPSYADYVASDNANPVGIGAQVYAFAKTQPDNAGAKDL